MIKAGNEAVIKISGEPVSATGLTCSTTDNKVYTIVDAAKRVLFYSGTVVVKDNGVVTTEKYKLNRVNGSVTFSTSNARVITIDASYVPLTQVASASVAKFAKSVDLMEIPKFGESFKKRLIGKKFAYGTLSQWDIEDTYFENALIAGTPVVIEMRSSDSGEPRRMFALLESSEMTAAIDNPQEESVSFISTDEFLGG